MSTYKIAENIRKEIATAIVKQSEPGYDTDFFGQYWAVDTDGDNTLDAVMHKESTAPWNPWHDNATAFPVSALYEDSNADFDPTNFDFESDDVNEDEAQEIAFLEAVSFAMGELPKQWNSEAYEEYA